MLRAGVELWVVDTRKQELGWLHVICGAVLEGKAGRCAEEAVDRIVLLELEAGEAQVREPPPQPPPWQVNASVVVRRPSSVRLRIALARA